MPKCGFNKVAEHLFRTVFELVKIVLTIVLTILKRNILPLKL